MTNGFRSVRRSSTRSLVHIRRHALVTSKSRDPRYTDQGPCLVIWGHEIGFTKIRRFFLHREIK